LFNSFDENYNITQPLTFAPAPPPIIVDMLFKFFIVL